MSGIGRYGAPIIATAILAGGTALGMASDDETHQYVSATTSTADDRPTTDPGSRSFERQPLSPSITPSITPSPKASGSAKPSRRVIATGTCEASFYWEPQGTASGETFDPEALTAAHKSLPFNTRVRVTNPANGKSVTVRINDRGPYVEDRCLDLSRAAFSAIAHPETGVLKSVRYEVLG